MTLPVSAKAISFIVTRDRAAAHAFYGGTLGFPLTHEDDFAAVYDLNGTMLRVSTVPDHAPQGHTVLGWDVPDIVAAVTALRGKGVAFTVYDGFGQDELGIWTAPASTAKVAWFTDPDGNVLSLTQFLRDPGKPVRNSEGTPMADDKRFEKANLNGAVFHDCSALGTRFDDVNLAESSFVNVNLRGSKFTDVNLSGVAIDDAKIDGLTIFGHDIQALIQEAGGRIR